jgi:CHAD domain-containing protein
MAYRLQSQERMGYRFQHRETVAQNVKRIANEEIGSATEYLRTKDGASREDSVHEVRKIIKKTRALLRLVRPELDASFRDQNVQLRDTGRKLSELRDADALIGVLEKLRKSLKDAAKGEPLSLVKRFLVRQKRHLEEDAAARKLLPDVARCLVRARVRARESIWSQIRLLKKLWGDAMEGYEHSLKELEDALGDDVNLAVLGDRVQALASADGSEIKTGGLTRAIDSARRALRKRALAIGEKVYAGKPRSLQGKSRGFGKPGRAVPLGPRPPRVRPLRKTGDFNGE